MPPPATLAIQNVNVISMVDEQPQPRRTVVIEAGFITVIGPAEQVAIPASAQVIDGAGRYLIPGLIDMHVHLVPHIVLPREGEDALTTSLDMVGEYLGVFLAFGVTTVRNMAGSDFLLKVRDAARAGRYPSPRIITSGPIIEQLFSWSGIATYAVNVKTPDAARAEVRRQAELGYDCLKVYNNIEADVFDAIMREGRAQGLKIGGHVPIPVGLIAALEAGQDTIEHLRGFDAWLDTRPFHERGKGWPGEIYSGWRNTTPQKMVELAELVAKYDNTWHAPTMKVEKMQLADPIYPQALLEQIPWSVRQHLEGLRNDLDYSRERRNDTLVAQAARCQMLLELDNRDVKLLAASDCPGARTRLIPGHSLLSEIETFVACGIRPFRALRAATVNPARYLALQDEIGTVEVGKRADLVLLDADPLANIANVRRQAGVFRDGRWYETGARGTSDVLAWTQTAVVARPPTGAGPIHRGAPPLGA